jgi:hypothetical protein
MEISELRQAIEFRARQCKGVCRSCGARFGGNAVGLEMMDLLSWIYDYCSNRCRRDAGEPEPFDLEEGMRRLSSKSS